MDLADLRHRVLIFHRRALYWTVVVALALGTAFAVARAIQRAQTARAAWGRALPTAVVSRDLPAGHRLAPGDVEVVDLPVPARPADALNEVEMGTVLTRGVFRGEALVAGRLGRDGAGPVAAALPDGHRGISIPLDEATPSVELGDRVELRAVTLDELGATSAELVGAGEVIGTSDTALTVAVPAARADSVVAGLVTGQVIPVVLPASGG